MVPSSWAKLAVALITVSVALPAVGCSRSQLKDRVAVSPQGPGPAISSPWPMARHDARHTSCSSAAGPRRPRIAWTRMLGVGLSPPVVAEDGTIYVRGGPPLPQGVSHDTSDRLYAIRPDGSTKWSVRFLPRTLPTIIGDDGSPAPAVAEDGTVYVGGSDGRLYAVGPNGRKKWSAPIGGRIAPSPVIAADGTVYVCAAGVGRGKRDSVFAIGADGSRKWVHRGPFGGATAPAIGPGGVIYLTTTDTERDKGSIYALNSAGRKKWDSTMGSPAWTSVSVAANGVAYVGSSTGSGGKLFAVRPHGESKVVFRAYEDFGSGSGEGIAIGRDGTLHVGVGALDGALFAIRPDGRRKWAFTLPNDEVLGSPAVDAKGTIYFGTWGEEIPRYGGSMPSYSVRRRFYALSADGAKMWSLKTDGPVMSPAIGKGRTVYFATATGRLYAIGER